MPCWNNKAWQKWSQTTDAIFSYDACRQALSQSLSGLLKAFRAVVVWQHHPKEFLLSA